MTQATLGAPWPPHLVSSPSHASGCQQTHLSTLPHPANSFLELHLTPPLQPCLADTPELRSSLNPLLPVSHMMPPASSSPSPTLATTPPACSLFNLPAADKCLSSLLHLQHFRPPAQPNTTIKSPIFSASESPACQGSLQTCFEAWAALLEHYPCRLTIVQILDAISHSVVITVLSMGLAISRLTSQWMPLVWLTLVVKPSNGSRKAAFL